MLKKIGLLGYSSHAERFPEILNLEGHPDFWPDSGAHIWAIWEPDAERAARAAEYGGIDVVASSPEEVVAGSDIVFVIARHPGEHLDLARPVIEARKPLFVDKPLTQTPADARELLTLVEHSGIPMTSFTTLRFGSDTERYEEGLDRIGTVRYASYIGPAQRKHPYGGLEFYAIHSVELMLQYHGVDVVSVQAVESPPEGERSNIVAACSFSDGTLVTLGLVGDGAYHFRMAAVGRDGVVDVERGMDAASPDATGLAQALGQAAANQPNAATSSARSDHYPKGMRKILAVLSQEEENRISHEEMLRSIQVCSAIEESLRTGAAVDPRTLL